MGKIPLSIATGRYDRVAALRDGSVPIEGVDPTWLELEPEELFFRMARNQEFDAAEMSLSTHLMQVVRGSSAYVGLPVFLSRAFRHSGFYIRTDRGIASPADLRGRVVGVPEYQMTASVWQRGLLSDEYGVPASAISWRTGGQEQPGREERSPFTPPPGTEIRRIPDDRTLSGMLASGELDGLITARPPSCFLAGAPNVARLFPDPRAAEKDWFRRTRLHPIMHLLVLRRSLAEQHPWLASSLYKAFVQAKQRALLALDRGAALAVTLPWVAQELAETRAVLGPDPWPYGLKESRQDLLALIRYSHEQGLIDRVVEPEVLFASSTLASAIT
jgi:4,5-dihydroxyphthalate decarboxylase